jgi:hypothetical protein
MAVVLVGQADPGVRVAQAEARQVQPGAGDDSDAAAAFEFLLDERGELQRTVLLRRGGRGRAAAEAFRQRPGGRRAGKRCQQQQRLQSVRAFSDRSCTQPSARATKNGPPAVPLRAKA